MAVRVGINGFGRIGRNFFRAARARDADLEIVAVNDIGDAKTMAHLLKHDSVLGLLDAEVTPGDGAISVDGKELKLLTERDPAALPWGDLGVQVVIESTGLFTKREDAQKHLDAGAEKVIISAPATDPDVTLVLGVNDDAYDKENHRIVSNASCTTNCVAPLAKVLNDSFGIEVGFMTTIHAYTNDQVLTDVYHSDLRRARSATMSMIPTKTGAAASVGLVLPELKGKLDGFSVRVPTINVSFVDLTFVAKRATTATEVNDILKKAAAGPLKGILEYTEEPLVSVDFNHNPASGTVDAQLTKVLEGTLVKVCAWYDNEWGFSNRMLDTTLAWSRAG